MAVFPRNQRLACCAVLLPVWLVVLSLAHPAPAQDPTTTATHRGIPADRIEWHIPDLVAARRTQQNALEQARRDGKKADINNATRVLERLDGLRRSNQVHLTLADVVRRTLENNFAIQTVSYNPAIETTRIVEAESVFDAVFFASSTNLNQNRPTASQLASTDAEFFTFNAGVRKLLATGGQLTGQYQLFRTKQSFAFQTLNPAFTSNWVLELRQPFLRGFGLDFNRSLIVLSRNNQRIGDLAFRRQVRDILRQVEERYWRLVQARRSAVVTARELADFEEVYDYLIARKDFDIRPVQLASTLADLELTRSEFVGRRAAVFDAEDRLTVIMNDPQINLASGVEIIPGEFLYLDRVVVDRLAEVQDALDNRTEIKEQELVVANATISIGRAENTELSRFDLTFRTTFQGLGASVDDSFSELSKNDFIDYSIGLDFDVPIGNRGPRAARRRAELERAQAAAQLKRTIEDIILDVNLSTRTLGTRFDQIAPNFSSMEAREREVNSIVARAERKDHNTLISELGARQALAGTRRAVLGVMVDYNIAVIDLERAKGTLLRHYGVVIP